MDAQKAADQAKKDRNAAAAAERAKLEAQIKAAQVDNAGTQAALKKAPITPETQLASKMALRVDLKLAAAIGKLPQQDQQDMIDLIEQALSGKQAEVDAANAKLAKQDADFKAITGEREVLKAQIPLLTEQARKAEEKAQGVQAELTTKTTEVVTWAQKKAEAEKQAGSLGGALDTLWHWVVGLGIVYFLIHWALPAIAQSYPHPVLTSLANAAKNLTTAHL